MYFLSLSLLRQELLLLLSSALDGLDQRPDCYLEHKGPPSNHHCVWQEKAKRTSLGASFSAGTTLDGPFFPIT